MDRGYDATAIYVECHKYHFEPIIDIRKASANNGEVDKYFAPTCLLEVSYKYDSFDKRYKALKFIRSEIKCRECPLANEGICQKVIKIKQRKDVKKYSNPERRTIAWKNKYKNEVL